MPAADWTVDWKCIRPSLGAPSRWCVSYVPYYIKFHIARPPSRQYDRLSAQYAKHWLPYTLRTIHPDTFSNR
ncbi:hypothetical protein BDZ89DRAFT_1080853 [Hymenopellis radicata]|nr:hypothetical protein BDZ89DRAFT_1084028 [Hymenopellis radicata]KAF9003791.1 hypothetical protein BDZ89DRAFT_1080853 [Hymenopellis radicata]